MLVLFPQRWLRSFSLSSGCLLAAGFVISSSLVTPALAVSVTNRDDKEHKLTIIEGDARTGQVLKPAGVIDGICMKGCIVRLGDSENDEYELEGAEVVSIEDGYLYYDGPEGTEMVPGEKTQPPSSQPPGGTDPGK